MVFSPRFSLLGWNIKQWAIGNYTTLKEVVKIGVPFVVATYLTNNPYLTALLTGFGKLVLDTLEYWSKEK